MKSELFMSKFVLFCFVLPNAEAKQRTGQLTSGYFGLLILHKDYNRRKLIIIPFETGPFGKFGC